MLKLNGANAQKAWEESNVLIEGMTPEQAFKIGFAMGEEAAPKQPTEEKELTETNNERKRKRKRRNTWRTYKQLERENRLVRDILRENGEPMPLSQITKALESEGVEWNKKSASGHMTLAIKKYPQIKKAGWGIYQYER
jgi:hypothetical protein